ncbi:hypothetical protein MSG28_008215 [Choristoneura fumiferana]|uniref:Uncharacterized protein n=1 Tax=Choristoneura fumiferana TaxID=7141 RepID=A0ACC0JAL0_CHOFU|nr:hypothetical protein MSG28_008215 [Choristoneura fumiferana]
MSFTIIPTSPNVSHFSDGCKDNEPQGTPVYAALCMFIESEVAMYGEQKQQVPRYSDVPSFFTTNKGHQVMFYRGFKFMLHRDNGIKKRWRCSKEGYRGCRAAVYTSLDGCVELRNEHNHPPGAFAKNLYNVSVADLLFYCSAEAVLVETPKNKRFVYLNGYRFSLQSTNKAGERWRCVRHWDGCRAAVYIDDIKVVKAINSHNHKIKSHRKRRERFKKTRYLRGATWTTKTMSAALLEYQMSLGSQSAIARKYGIPRKTFNDHVRTGSSEKRLGRRPRTTQDMLEINK